MPVCNVNGISEHTVDFNSGAFGEWWSPCEIPLNWAWQYRIVVTAVTATNGNMIGYSGSSVVVGDSMDPRHDGVSALHFGGTSGIPVFTTKDDLGIGVLGSSGSWSGFAAGQWRQPVGPDPAGVDTVRLRGGWDFSCNFAVPACAGSITWRLEVKDEFGVLLDPGRVPDVGGPPGASGFGGPCGCPPFAGAVGELPARNQPIRNETAGTGNGTQTVFTTAFPYVPNSLRVEVAGFVVPIDTTTPSTGSFTILGAPPTGELVTASYEAA